MIVTFDVPNAVATELNTIAQKNGFPNAKAMTIEYWKATIHTARQVALDAAAPVAGINDVVVG